MKKSFVVANAIMLALILILDVFYMLNGGLLLKSITSSMFVITGLINLRYCVKKKAHLKYPIWMNVALVFAMLGDILLGINFYIGVAAFAMGHIFYIVSYCMLERMNRRDLIYGMMIFIVAVSIILFVPFLNFKSTLMQGVCCLYALIISFMLGKAISNFVSDNTLTNRIIMIGSMLFFFSDLMLVLRLFGGIRNASYKCLGNYYPAQFLLAFSLFVYASTKCAKQRRFVA